MAGRQDKSRDPQSGPFNNPFGSLDSLRRKLPEGAAPARPTEQVPARAVVRLERKGRGGKEVTIVSHLALKPDRLAVWLKGLKNELGCGGNVEDDLLVLQGDQRERAKAALLARGVGQVTLG